MLFDHLFSYLLFFNPWICSWMYRCLEPLASEEENMEYTKQLILSCLLNICQKLSPDGNKIPAGKNCQIYLLILWTVQLLNNDSYIFSSWRLHCVVKGSSGFCGGLFFFVWFCFFVDSVGMICRLKPLLVLLFILPWLTIRVYTNELFFAHRYPWQRKIQCGTDSSVHQNI